MNKQIIEFAQKAGFMLVTGDAFDENAWFECFPDQIERFAELVRQDYANQFITDAERDENIRSEERIQEEIERLKVEIKRGKELADYRLQLLMKISVATDKSEISVTADKPWVGLTDEEIDEIYKQNHNQYGEDTTGEYERELEAKLREKNNG